MSHDNVLNPPANAAEQALTFHAPVAAQRAPRPEAGEWSEASVQQLLELPFLDLLHRAQAVHRAQALRAADELPLSGCSESGLENRVRSEADPHGGY